MSTGSCKTLLDHYDSKWLRSVEDTSGLVRTGWARSRKHAGPDGLTYRDFTNRGVPVVVVVSEGPQGLAIARERGLGMWEREFLPFVDWYDGSPYAATWEQRYLWPTLRTEDFVFGRSEDEHLGFAFFFQPKTVPKGEVWDQHSPLYHLFEAIGLDGGEVCESTYCFPCGSELGRDVTPVLIAAGFAHEPKLDGTSGS